MKSLASIAILVSVAAGAWAQQVEVTLAPPMQEVIRGEAPRFEVTVRALEKVRVANLAKRPDIMQHLAKPRLTGQGEMDDMPVALVPTGPVGGADYLALEPGATMVFPTRGEPFKLGVLAPGEYTVYLRYRADFPAPIVESSRVKFRVVAPKDGKPTAGNAGLRR